MEGPPPPRPAAAPEADSKPSPLDPEHVPRFAPDEEAVRAPSGYLVLPPLTADEMSPVLLVDKVTNEPGICVHQALVAESQSYKLEANKLFAASKYDDAIARYQDAVAACPTYLDYDLAVLRSNLAACHLKLDQWKEAIKCATDSIEGLDRLERAETEENRDADKTPEMKVEPEGRDPPKDEPQQEDQESEVEEEIVSAGAAKASPQGPPAPEPAEPVIDPVAEKRRRQDDIKRIRAKALMRRARARSELGGWSNLSGAEDDYKVLAAMDNLGPGDRKIVQSQLRALPPRTKAAQEKETAEMWGKLKDLGNGLLRPFGLSTDNFQMIKDEKTGGYSMNFKSNGS